MKRLRLFLAVISAMLIAVGYLASQVAFTAGTVQEYSAKVDSPGVVFLSLVLFLVAVGFAFLPDKKESSD